MTRRRYRTVSRVEARIEGEEEEEEEDEEQCGTSRETPTAKTCILQYFVHTCSGQCLVFFTLYHAILAASSDLLEQTGAPLNAFTGCTKKRTHPLCPVFDPWADLSPALRGFASAGLGGRRAFNTFPYLARAVSNWPTPSALFVVRSARRCACTPNNTAVRL